MGEYNIIEIFGYIHEGFEFSDFSGFTEENTDNFRGFGHRFNSIN